MKVLFKPTMVAMCISAAACAQAQQEGVSFGIDTQVVHDDNIFRNSDEQSDTFFQLSPELAYKGLYGKHEFTAAYTGDYAFYTDNDDVNYTNHKATAGLDLGLTSKWRLKFGLQYTDAIEAPGTNNQVLNDVTEFNQFSTARANIETSYGRTQSAGQVVFKYGHQTFDYDNNNQQFRDRSQDDVTGTFFWRVAPKSRMIFEVRAADVSSDNIIGFNQSFEQVSYLTGVTWEATAKTEGSIRVGYQDTDYENPLIADLDGLSYFADVDWKPDTDSIVTIALSRTARDNPELILAGLETTDFSVNYKTPIIRNFALALKYSYRKDEFGGGLRARADDTNTISTQVSYTAFKWLDVYVGYEFKSRDSDDAIYEYDNNRISLGVVVAFD